MEFDDLTTLADVKAWLQTGHSAFPVTDDGLLTRLITAASQYIQSWLSRPVTLADYIEVRDGTGGEALQFACFPVVDVQLLTIEGQAIPPASSTRASGYVFSQTQLFVRGFRFNRGIQNVTISYSAGYKTIPPDISQACIELVALRYRERTRIGEVSKSLGGAETVTYAQKDLTDAIKTLLQAYRMVIPVAAVRPIFAPSNLDAGSVTA
jgi:hypothetical protein